MTRVQVITDSNAQLTPEEMESLGIHVIPHTIRLGRKTYVEGNDVTSEGFLEQLRRTSMLPELETPPISELTQLFEHLSRSSDEIIAIHVSSRISDMVRIVRTAANELMGRSAITVIDSLSAAMGLGELARAAGQAAQDGADLEEVVRIVRGMVPHMYLMLCIEDLAYLEREERISHAQGVLGTMLGIKPVLMVDQGEIIPLEKVRTRENAVQKIYEFIIEFSNIERMTVLQSNFIEHTTMLLERLELIYPDRDFPVMAYPPSLAVHLGPSAMGVVVYERPE